MRKRVIFVDDEEQILAGLKRMLRPLREEWGMDFAQSGPEALEKMEQEPFDVIVTDMRMPGMDGAQLLRIVSDRYPDMVRIVLSGYANEDLVYKSVPFTHQYLAKPIEADKLKAVVSRALALRSLLKNETIKKLVTRIDTLPSMPKLYMSLLEELKSPEASTKSIGNIISKDLGMTAKILKLVNSAYFGIRRHVQSPEQAVMFLGLNTIKAIVLSTEIFSQYDEKKLQNFSLEKLYNHSVTVGSFAKIIAEAEVDNKKNIGDSLMAGMLHDLGKLILIDNLPEQYSLVLEQCQNDGKLVWEVEQDLFGVSHAEVGAYLLGLWGLPDDIVEAVAYHHHPSHCVHQSFSPLTAVHVANWITYHSQESPAENPDNLLESAYVQLSRLTEKLPLWEQRCLQLINEK